jgi:hypothetical protein
MKRFVRLYGIGYSQIPMAVVKKLSSACPTCEEAPEAVAIIAFPRLLQYRPTDDRAIVSDLMANGCPCIGAAAIFPAADSQPPSILAYLAAGGLVYGGNLTGHRRRGLGV